ncbi:SH3 domain-containing protein, partial [Planosporangium flavigriseum]|nr:SH3 domain-containing protein [Planosporangium flavigriseum]
MNPKIRRLLLGALLATTTTGTVLGVNVEAASAASGVGATVRTTGGPLNVRSGPSAQTANVGQVRNGSVLTLVCQTSGQYIKGPVRASSQWDRLTSGRWVSHAYLQTNASLPACAALDAPATAAPTNPAGATARTDGSPLNVRSQPNSRAALSSRIPNGAGVNVSCYVTGETVRGTVRSTAQWDRLSSGGYVSHAYVQTSATLPACAPNLVPVSDTAPAPAPTPATYSGTAKTEGGPLNIRTAPSGRASAAGAVANGGALTLTCTVGGDHVTGAVRSTSQWDRLVSGNYVSHAYVETSASLPTCAGGA